MNEASEDSIEGLVDIKEWIEQKNSEARALSSPPNCGANLFSYVSLFSLAPMPFLAFENVASFTALFTEDSNVIFYVRYVGGSFLAILAVIPSAWFARYGAILFAKRMSASNNKCKTFLSFLPFYFAGTIIAGGTFYFATQAFDFEVLPIPVQYTLAGIVAGFTGIPNGGLLRALFTKLDSYPFIKAIRYGIQRIFYCCCPPHRQLREYRLEQKLEEQLIYIEFGLRDNDITAIAQKVSNTVNPVLKVAQVMQEVESYHIGRNPYRRYVAYCIIGGGVACSLYSR